MNPQSLEFLGSSHPLQSNENHTKTYSQIPAYPDHQSYLKILAKLREQPPLVDFGRTKTLLHAIHEAQEGRAFILQIGECAERFSQASFSDIKKRIVFYLEMTGLLEEELKLPVICLARMAGQYAKPRSHPFEWEGKNLLLNYKGDLINSEEKCLAARQPSPNRLWRGYQLAQRTLQIIEEILCQNLYREKFFVSHEGLHLDFERQLIFNEENTYFSGSAHSLWIGSRTNQEEDYLNFFKNIANPIGIKVGDLSPEQVLSLLNTLNPNKTHGRLSLILRLGMKKIENLPAIIECVQKAHQPVLWSCDPLHGNQNRLASGHKVRYLEDIYAEIERFCSLLKLYGLKAGGLHLEATPDPVLECLSYKDDEKYSHYQSACDPRLNQEQTKNTVLYFLSQYKSALSKT